MRRRSLRALERLGSEFAEIVLRFDPDPRPLFGLEHEYVVTRHGVRVDFRDLVHGLGLGRACLDPVDPNAYRLSTGHVVTADEAEAEIALPPLPCEPGVVFELQARAESARRLLDEALPPECETDGCSTHLNVEVPPDRAEPVCHAYVRTFAPALMLLLDRPTSPGLLVRPRPRRVELGGEFVDGARLRAAAVFALGSVLACLDGRVLPPELAVVVIPDHRRFGWYVDRRAFGVDLYRQGRSALLPLARTGVISAQAQLETAWGLARGAVAPLLDPEEIEPVDRIVTGEHPLPSEEPLADGSYSRQRQVTDSVFGGAMTPRARPGFELAPVMATWDVTIYVVVNTSRTRRAFACVPRRALERFITLLDDGDLDRVIAAYVATRPGGRRLAGREQAERAGLYDELGPRKELLPLEHGPDRAMRVFDAELTAAT